jgi:hypothetical protein
MTAAPTKRVVVLQSAYVPWKGFFDLLSRADLFVIYDSASYSKNHWHNRNRIKRSAGSPWLTIPVTTADRLGQPIQDVKVARPWAEQHWSLLRQSYAGLEAYKAESPFVEALYVEAAGESNLSLINELFLRALMKRLGVQCEIARHDTVEQGNASGRLLRLLERLGATHYLSGPSAKTYLDTAVFAEAGIHIEWMEYGPYASYPQPHGDFEHQVSVLDLLFCAGDQASDLIKPEHERFDD